MDVFWQAENIQTIAIYLKIGSNEWELKADNILAIADKHSISLPKSFKNGETVSLKLHGNSVVAMVENIETKNFPTLPKTIQIKKIFPAVAIASEQLTVYFSVSGMNTVIVALINSKDELLNQRIVISEDGLCVFDLPPGFDKNEKLKVEISSEGIIAARNFIETKNVFIIETKNYPELAELGGITKVMLGGTEIWLKRISVEMMHAYSGHCTHSGCLVDYLKEDKVFYCSCHGSKFTSDGEVINGPALLPLQQQDCLFVKDGIFKLFY